MDVRKWRHHGALLLVLTLAGPATLPARELIDLRDQESDFAAEPNDARELDDSYQDSITVGTQDEQGTRQDGDTSAAEETIQAEDAFTPGESPPGHTGQANGGTEALSAYMHRYDHVGLYAREGPDDDRLEGIYFYGYQGPVATRGGGAGLVSIFSADLPVAADEDGLGEAYLGFGLQGSTGRVSLYGTLGATYARTVGSSDGNTESDTSLGSEAGLSVALGQRSMVSLAMRDDPNDLIDDRTARLGFHFGAAYIGLRQRLEAEVGRLDLAFRF